MEIRHVGVIGAGTMGAGIGQSAAVAGYEVTLFDVDGEMLDTASKRIDRWIEKAVELGKVKPVTAMSVKKAIRLTRELPDVAKADLIIEAVPEKMQLKSRLFSELDTIASSKSILASNTSSLSISALAAATNRPQQVIGLHYFNPAHIMKLVEVIRGDLTADHTIEQCVQFVETLGKVAVLCRDTPAFIVNRVARPFYGEAFRLLGEQAADAATIDHLMRSAGFRMGPFELIDLIGADVNLEVTQSVYDAYFQEPRFRPHPIQERMVASGRLGRKAGRGFYTYDKE